MVLYIFITPLVQAFFYAIGLIILVIWNNQAIGMHTFAIIIPVLLLILITFTAGLFLSIFEVYIQDTSKVITYILRFGFYVSPVLYSPERIYEVQAIPKYFKSLYALNPMVPFITAVRDLLFYGRMFDYQPILTIFICTLLIMQAGLYFFRTIAPNIPKKL